MIDRLFSISYFAELVTSGSLVENVPEVRLLCPKDNKTYLVKCFDDKSNELVCSGEVSKDKVYKGIRQWYTKWRVEIYDEKDILIKQDILELKNKNVSIIMGSALGDTLAWFPYIEEFRKKHDCNIIVSCKHIDFFKENYTDIVFVPYEVPIYNAYAQYILRIAWDSNPVVHPQPIDYIPLQQWSADILGIPFKEIRPKIVIPIGARPFNDKYVCLCEYVSGELNNWAEKDGYQNIVDYLNKQGYKVVAISLEPNTLSGVIDKTGCTLQEAMVYLKYADFFVGGSTGLAWLSWAIGCYVFMINSYTPHFHEFQENCTHIWEKDFTIEKFCTTNEEVQQVQKHPVKAEVVINAINKHINK